MQMREAQVLMSKTKGLMSKTMVVIKPNTWHILVYYIMLFFFSTVDFSCNRQQCG